MGMMMAAAGGGVAAVQADLLRAGRRLVTGGGQPGAELRGVAGDRADYVRGRTQASFNPAFRMPSR
jgi:hypothetical protein